MDHTLQGQNDCTKMETTSVIPSEKLILTPSVDKPNTARGSIVIHNPTRQSILYKFKSNAADKTKLAVSPCTGYVQPGEQAFVDVNLTYSNQEDLDNLKMLIITAPCPDYHQNVKGMWRCVKSNDQSVTRVVCVVNPPCTATLQSPLLASHSTDNMPQPSTCPPQRPLCQLQTDLKPSSHLKPELCSPQPRQCHLPTVDHGAFKPAKIFKPPKCTPPSLIKPPKVKMPMIEMPTIEPPSCKMPSVKIPPTPIFLSVAPPPQPPCPTPVEPCPPMKASLRSPRQPAPCPPDHGASASCSAKIDCPPRISLPNCMPATPAIFMASPQQTRPQPQQVPHPHQQQSSRETTVRSRVNCGHKGQPIEQLRAAVNSNKPSAYFFESHNANYPKPHSYFVDISPIAQRERKAAAAKTTACAQSNSMMYKHSLLHACLLAAVTVAASKMIFD